MSNPVGTYIVYNLYDNHFRDTWLKTALSTSEYADVHTINLSVLRDLYPFIYNYGPQGNDLYRILKKLNDYFDTWFAESNLDDVTRLNGKTSSVVEFLNDLERLIKTRPTLDAAIVARLHDQMRPIRFSSKVDLLGHAGEVTRLRKRRDDIISLSGRGRSMPHVPVMQGIELLLSDIMLTDVHAAHQPVYHHRVENFLNRWQLT